VAGPTLLIFSERTGNDYSESCMKTILLISIVIFSTWSCKKQHRYPEDPKKSRKTPLERLHGSWKIEEYTFKGSSIVSQLDLLKQDAHVKNVQFYFYVEYHQETFSINSGAFPGYHTFNALIDETYLRIGPYNEFMTVGPANEKVFTGWFVTPFRYTQNGQTKWTITKLFESDLNIILPTDSGEYKIFLRKI
jgi:hypothetical protein